MDSSRMTAAVGEFCILINNLSNTYSMNVDWDI